MGLGFKTLELHTPVAFAPSVLGADVDGEDLIGPKESSVENATTPMPGANSS
jgi:hypothetical protein